MNLRNRVYLAGAALVLASPFAHADQAPATADATAAQPAAVTAPAPAPAPATTTATPTATKPSAGEIAEDEQKKDGVWELVISPGAYHFSNEDAHTHVYLVGIEREQPDNFLWGFSAFQNSFGQASAYAYYGYTWNEFWPGHPNWYIKLTGGIIYGYTGKYEDKVPFNHNGFGLGIIPGLGYRFTPKDAAQINLLGSAGLIFTYNRRF